GKNDVSDPQRENYLDNKSRNLSDKAEANNVTIHSIALGAGADRDLLKDITTENGTYEEASAGELVELFEDIIGDIKREQKETKRRDTGGTDTKIVTRSSNSGAIEEIYDLTFNVTNFQTNDEFAVNITENIQRNITVNGTTRTRNVSVSLWRLTVDNSLPSDRYEVRLRYNNSGDSGMWDWENKTYDPPSVPPSPPTGINDTSEYVYFDVMGNEMEGPPVTRNGGIDLHPEVITDNYPVSFKMENTPPGDVPSGVTGVANGTFSLDFKPVNGNYTSLEKNDASSVLNTGV
ncbi:MAG: hypothetical protein SXQ77_03160, partial [Halobacteria archaeon]|nr:hypothetical protein [Halobacteria archaeon]